MLFKQIFTNKIEFKKTVVDIPSIKKGISLASKFSRLTQVTT
jgi:hypothetical protein